MSNWNASPAVQEEARALFEKIQKAAQSPTPGPAMRNRIKESLTRIQQQAWNATDEKWQELLAAEQDTSDALRKRCERLEAAIKVFEEHYRTCEYTAGDGSPEKPNTCLTLGQSQKCRMCKVREALDGEKDGENNG